MSRAEIGKAMLPDLRMKNTSKYLPASLCPYATYKSSPLTLPFSQNRTKGFPNRISSTSSVFTPCFAASFSTNRVLQRIPSIFTLRSSKDHFITALCSMRGRLKFFSEFCHGVDNGASHFGDGLDRSKNTLTHTAEIRARY